MASTNPRIQLGIQKIFPPVVERSIRSGARYPLLYQTRNTRSHAAIMSPPTMSAGPSSNLPPVRRAPPINPANPNRQPYKFHTINMFEHPPLSVRERRERRSDMT